MLLSDRGFIPASPPGAAQRDVVAPYGAIECAYESLLDSSGWGGFLNASATQLGADAALVIGPGRGRSVIPSPAVGFSRAALEQYAQYFHHVDPWWHEARAPARGEYRLLHGERITPDSSLLSSEFYLEFLRPAGLRWMRALIVSPDADISRPYVVAWLRRSSRDPFSPADDHVIAELGGHLVRVERIAHAQVFGRRPGTEGRAGRESAVFVLGQGARLLQANGPAAALIARSVMSERNEALRPGTQEAEFWLHGALARVADRPLRRGAAGIPLSNEGSARTTLSFGQAGTYEFELAPISGLARSLGLLDAQAVLTVRPGAAPQADAMVARLRSLYGWTAREVQTVWRLAAGLSPAQIATERGCSVETVRTHLKHAKRKAGVRRQVELVGLLYRFEVGDA